MLKFLLFSGYNVAVRNENTNEINENRVDTVLEEAKKVKIRRRQN